MIAQTACFLLFLLIAGMTNATADVSVEASVQDPVMSLGQSNEYTITIHDAASAPRPESPEAPGLVFSQNPSTRNSNRMINGVLSRKLEYTWTFQAENTGKYVIPESRIRLGDREFRLNEVTVEVREMPAEMRNRFILRWKAPEGPFYVGQAIPATLQLLVRADINAGLGSPPEGSSDQFVRTEFAREPRQRQLRIEGRPYVAVEWDTVVTPIRPGTSDLPMNLVLVYETGRKQRSFFGSRAEQEQMRLTTESVDWEILDLPQKDRPANFSGAVGNFEIQGKLSRNEGEAGDPLTFTLKVEGEGNFDRIQAPELAEADGWRVYPPRAKMEEGEVPYRGVKEFEYILTPTSETVQKSPAASFSWFNPDEASWEEVEIAPEAVEIRPGSSSIARGSPTETDGSQAEAGDGDFTPMAASLGPRQSLKAPWTQPSFWVVNGGLSGLAAFALIGLIRNRRTALSPYLQVRSQAAQKAKDLATQAVAAADAGDALTFYTQARHSLRHFLATIDSQSHNPESLTWDDLEKILKRSAFDENMLTRIGELFGRKDALQFAGWKPTQNELDHDRNNFETLLNQIVTRT